MPSGPLPQPPPSAIAEVSWTAGSPHPVLAERAVHVWRADLAAVSDDVCGLLCEEEQERAESLLSEHGRQLWMRSRGVLRALLGGYLAQDPRTLRFATGTHGKPALLDDSAGRAASESQTAQEGQMTQAPRRMSFNLSHSGNMALYGFTTAGSVGVDLERAHRPVDEVAIAGRIFGAAEAERLRELDPGDREREFLRAWARHEAKLKCLGVGIGGAAELDAGGGLWVAELEVGPDAAGAVAMEPAPRELLCWEWSP
jgi:4'-phosphopantetheinyl transferase